ncbi:hypothetical protein [Catellatospora sp. IY07-71]|nr:hypothetical protein [Catellatospora sp. IY07-71]
MSGHGVRTAAAPGTAPSAGAAARRRDGRAGAADQSFEEDV